ncbi:MAG: AI-2E family transporter [Bacillota bacterium]|nr:AI-2E family transporter [Bacillota bacterium]
MKKVESNWIKFIFAGTALILIYKLINNFHDVSSLFNMIISVLFPCILGAVIAFFLYRPAYKLEQLVSRVNVRFINKNARPIATLFLYLIIFLLIGFGIRYLIPKLYRNIEELINNAPRYFAVVDEYISHNKYLSNFNSVDIVNSKISEYFNMAQINKYISVISGIANSFISVFVSVVISIYIILDRISIMNYMKRVRQAIFRGRFEFVTVYIKRIITLFYSYFAGLAADAIVVGVITSIGLSVMKVPYSVLLGLLTAIGNMVPFFGPILSTIVVVLISLIAGGLWKVMSVLIFLAVLYAIDGYFIQPKVVSSSTGIRPLLVLVSVIVFGDLFGFVGMIIGVPLSAACKMIIDDYLDNGKADCSSIRKT